VQILKVDSVEEVTNEIEHIDTDSITNRLQVECMDYLKAMDQIQEDYEVVDYFEYDLNADGQVESLVSVGFYSDDIYEKYINKVYVIGKNPELAIINTIEDAYSIYDVDIIQLSESKDFFIHCKLTNGGNLEGFALYKLEGSELISVWHSASATGAGNSELVDKNEDGLYDSYIQDLWSYDVLWYRTHREFSWYDNQFVLMESVVDVYEYPSDIVDVVMQFISLSMIDDNVSLEIRDRITEICIEDFEYSFESISFNDIVSAQLMIDGYMIFDVSEDGSKGEVLVSSDEEAMNDYEYQFMMTKIEGKWHVEKVIIN